MSIYKDLLEYNIKAIVKNQDMLDIQEEVEEGIYKLTFSVDPSDNGKVIGKEGGNFRALKRLINASARKDGQSVQIKFNPIKSEE